MYLIVTRAQLNLDIRRVYNTALENINGSSFSSIFPGPKQTLASAVQVCVRGDLFESQFSTDVSKCFSRLRLCNKSKNVCCSIAPVINPDGTIQKYIYLRAKSYLFGVPQSNSAVVLGDRKFLMPAATSEACKNLILLGKFVDDAPESTESNEESKRLYQEYKEVHEKYSCPLKPVVGNLDLFPENVEDIKLWLVDTFGKFKNFARKTYSSSTELNIFPSRRGRQTGPNIQYIDIVHDKLIPITRRNFLRILGEMYELVGKSLTPVLIKARLKMKKLLKLIEENR